MGDRRRVFPDGSPREVAGYTTSCDVYKYRMTENFESRIVRPSSCYSKKHDSTHPRQLCVGVEVERVPVYPIHFNAAKIEKKAAVLVTNNGDDSEE